MKPIIVILALCWPPLPEFPTLPDKPVPAPIPDAVPEAPSVELTVEMEIAPPKRTIIGYRKVCVNGVCRQVPVYAEPAPIPDKSPQSEAAVKPAPLPTDTEIAFWQRTGEAPPKPAPHTHAETGNEVCPFCGGTCWMLRMAERAAAKKGTSTGEEFTKRYGSSTRAAGTHSQQYRPQRPVGPIRKLLGRR